MKKGTTIYYLRTWGGLDVVGDAFLEPNPSHIITNQMEKGK